MCLISAQMRITAKRETRQQTRQQAFSDHKAFESLLAPESFPTRDPWGRGAQLLRTVKLRQRATIPFASDTEPGPGRADRPGLVRLFERQRLVGV